MMILVFTAALAASFYSQTVETSQVDEIVPPEVILPAEPMKVPRPTLPSNVAAVRSASPHRAAPLASGGSDAPGQFAPA